MYVRPFMPWLEQGSVGRTIILVFNFLFTWLISFLWRQVLGHMSRPYIIYTKHMLPQHLCTGLECSSNRRPLPAVSLLKLTFLMRPTQNALLITAHLHLPAPTQISPHTYHLLTCCFLRPLFSFCPHQNMNDRNGGLYLFCSPLPQGLDQGLT